MLRRSRVSPIRLVVCAGVLLAGLPAQADEVRFWTLNFANATQNEAFQQIIKQFQAANPGTTIVLETRGTDEHKAALRVAGGSNQAPDIYFNWAGLGLGGEAVKSGLAAPMDKYYAQYKHVQYKKVTPLQAVWIKIFGQYEGLFVNGDQAFPLDVTTEFWRIINRVASDKLAPAQGAADLQKFIANRK